MFVQNRFKIVIFCENFNDRRKFVREICRNRLTNSYHAGVLVLSAPPLLQ